MTYDQLADRFRRLYGKGDFHAAALYRAFFRSPDMDLEALPAFAGAGLRQQVRADLDIDLPQVVAQVCEDGVTKVVFGLRDGLKIESVLIPMANHATVCISSQVGCRMGCRFCRTGRMGWQRDLTAGEIVAQVYMVKQRFGRKVRNVVFMGMGEPLDNFDNVVQAVRVMADQRGLDIAKRHMTLSTVGLPEAIGRLAALDWPQLKLAVSLNAPNDGVRDMLMPVNRRYPMEALRTALGKYPLARGNALFMEYVLIKGVNDRPEHARQLAGFFKGLTVKLNLIPYNPSQRSVFQAPDAEGLARFHQALVDQRIFVRVRGSKGAQIQAACGQLGGSAEVCAGS